MYNRFGPELKRRLPIPSTQSIKTKSARLGLMAKLAIPWVDKTIAILASLPFAVELYRRWMGSHVNFPRVNGCDGTNRHADLFKLPPQGKKPEVSLRTSISFFDPSTLAGSVAAYTRQIGYSARWS